MAAGLAVALLDGVQGLSNRIQVRPNVSEVQIQAVIDEALRRVGEVDAQHVRVSVDGPVSRCRDTYVP